MSPAQEATCRARFRARHYNQVVRLRSTTDSWAGPLWEEPPSPNERWRATAYLGSTALMATLGGAGRGLRPVRRDRRAADCVSVVLPRLPACARHRAPALRRGAVAARRPLSRGLAALAIYGAHCRRRRSVPGRSAAHDECGAGTDAGAGARNTPRVSSTVARARKAGTRRWGFPVTVNEPIDAADPPGDAEPETKRSAISADELVDIKGLVPWLSTVPVVVVSPAHALAPLPPFHLARAADPAPPVARRRVPRNLNGVLAAYTRAQTLFGAVIVGDPCAGSASRRSACRIPARWRAAGLLEMIPLAGPLVVAVVTTRSQPDRSAGHPRVPRGAAGCCRTT